MATKGKFIVFEGCDGSGKSTQLKLLASYLESKGEEVYLTREPTDSPFGSLIHSCLTGRIVTDEHTIAALFAADRLDHIHNALNGILRKLEEGVTVLCDRFYLSSFAYNGGFAPLEWVISLNTPAMAATASGTKRSSGRRSSETIISPCSSGSKNGKGSPSSAAKKIRR